ncbi:hypothetical protein SAMN05443999_103262 [Roseovarius azorensis]|uniref:Uncharacterized protein n=2 Tax=Roseovarius azorensis TaxID=1287727 RepID=A0A1H7MBC0_9RHOB|nr:hypothetical protein SAMN05443999_103262 [Roseovarius azorensis]
MPPSEGSVSATFAALSRNSHIYAEIWPQSAATCRGMIKRFSSRLLDATLSIPPIRVRNVLPVLIMLMIWIGLQWAQVGENMAFVLAVVVAQAYAIWRNLPQAAHDMGQMRAGRPAMLRWPVAALLLLAALQIWLNDPLLTQRLITAFAVFFLVVMVLGVMREGEMLDRITPRSADGTPEFKVVSLLRVNALVATLVICVNETLIAFETPAIWITVMPVFVLVLHGFYWLIVLMLVPSDSQPA